MMNKLKSIGNYFKDFGTAVVKGDIWVKLSLFIMGAGYIARKQVINGLKNDKKLYKNYFFAFVNYFCNLFNSYNCSFSL